MLRNSIDSKMYPTQPDFEMSNICLLIAKKFVYMLQNKQQLLIQFFKAFSKRQK